MAATTRCMWWSASTRKPHVSARSLARPDVLRCLDRGLADLVRQWKPAFWAEEHGQIISGVGPFLQRRAIERQAYTCREQFVSRGDKAVRAQSMRGRMAMLGLYVRQGAPWFADLRAELLSFPAGRHDDQVDALGLVGQLLDKISAGPRPKPPDVKQPDGYRAAFEEIPGDNWKTM